MGRIVYIDSLFILNLAVNYLILLATAKIAAVQIRRWRLGLGALFGAVYAVLTVFPSLEFLALPLMRVVSGAAMLLVAFGGARGLLRLAVILFAVSAAFGGVLFAVSLAVGSGTGDGAVQLPFSLKILLISFALCYGIFSLVFARLGRNAGGKLLQTQITHQGKSVQLTALLDTGHSLADPLTGGSVLVAEFGAILPLFTPGVRRCLEGSDAALPIDTVCKLANLPDAPRFYLIPYTAVGTQSSFLPAFRPECVTIEGKAKRGMAIALSPTRVSDGGRYAALVNEN